MFLALLKRRNPALLEAAAVLHQGGIIPPNCYVIDLDQVAENATALKAEADRLGLAVFAMTKQIGRNPDVSRTLVHHGITHAVGVDLDCALAAVHGGLGLGHVGHLVQVPRNQASLAASLDPLYWTVFSHEKAIEAGAASRDAGRSQPLLARIVAEGDRFYPGHEGGFDAADIIRVADALDAVDGGQFAGVTTFPASLFDPVAGRVLPTHNMTTLTRAAEALRSAGRSGITVNAPGTTSSATLAGLADAGATQVEPGHGLTGTTPWHAVEDLVEGPAIVYVSEVSHHWGGSAFVFGGGLYVDPVLEGAPTDAVIVRTQERASAAATYRVDMPAAAAIDYYAKVPVPATDAAPAGSTVLFGFRPQVFVTRALTAAVSGISRGEPRLEGLWASDGSAPLTAEHMTRDPMRGHRP
jgi:predicted amino acid racemase